MQAVWGFLLYFVPKNLLSYVVGKLVHLQLPQPFAGWSVRWFVRRYKLNMEEAEKATSAYNSIGQVFTRHLKPGIRPIGSGFVHPVDGQLSRAGQILQGQLVQAKSKYYSLEDFLKSPKGSKEFLDGYYLTYYLCPTDYHRVHSPVSGKISSVNYIPGRLWPVNPWSVSHISQLFAINERMVINIDTEKGKIALVMVGATNVGKMSLSFDPEIVTNQSHWRSIKRKDYKPAVSVVKGQELGVFNMGSTVIVVAPPNYFAGLPDGVGGPTRLGESLVVKQF